MKSLKHIIYCCAALSLLTAGCAKADLQTHFGKLEFKGGYATEKTSLKLHEKLDESFALTAMYWAMPLMESAAFIETAQQDHGVENNTAWIYDQKIAPGHEVMTPNQSVIYLMSVIDLTNGPVVVEVPANVLGTIFDLWQRGTADPGFLGPDKGKGGKYLILPPGYDKDVPDGYYVVRANGNLNLFISRRYLTPTHSAEQATDYQIKHTNIYPLAQAKRPSALKYKKIGNRPFRTSGHRLEGLEYWKQMHKFINLEVVDPRDRAMMGILAKLGIQKGRPFAPDEKLAKFLEEIEPVGTAMIANETWDFRPEVIGMDYLYDKGHHRWWNLFYFDGVQEKEHFTPVYERGFFHWQAYGQQKFWKPSVVIPGKSTFALGATRDKQGHRLYGSNTYRLHVEPNVPAKNFWAITAYDIDTRGVLENKTGKSEFSSAKGDFESNSDGSVDIYLSPEKPKSVATSNWIETVPGKGFFCYFRFYGVLEPLLERNWRPQDFKKIK
jgi:hypothetical protein